MPEHVRRRQHLIGALLASGTAALIAGVLVVTPLAAARGGRHGGLAITTTSNTGPTTTTTSTGSKGSVGSTTATTSITSITSTTTRASTTTTTTKTQVAWVRAWRQSS
jgi:hypothetical protein